MSLVEVLIGVIVGGAIGGLIRWRIAGAAYRWTGSWLGGQATREEVRCAVAWASIPDVFPLILAIPFIGVFGINWFSSSADWLSPDMARYPLLLLGVIGFTLLAWKAVLFVKCLAEVHRFSAWRGLAASVLGVLAINVPILILLQVLGV